MGYSTTRRSVFAFLLVGGALATTILLAGLARLSISEDPARGYAWSVTGAIFALVYLGWPLFSGIAVERRTGLRGSRARVIAFIAYPHVIALYLLFVPLTREFHANPIYMTFMVCWLFSGMVATIYILRFGAMTLVAAERGQPVRIDHYLGTFLLFYVLPIGVLFLQRRLRKLLLPPEEGTRGDVPESALTNT